MKLLISIPVEPGKSIGVPLNEWLLDVSSTPNLLGEDVEVDVRIVQDRPAADGSGWRVFTAPGKPEGTHRTGVYRIEGDAWQSLIPVARGLD